MKRLILLMLIFSSLNIAANDIELNGIIYNISSVADRTVEVAGLADYSLTEMIIPEKIEIEGMYYTVNKIADRALNTASGYAEIMNIKLPTSIKKIGDFAFDKCCSKITSIEIPESTESIGLYAFSGDNLKDVYFLGSSINKIDMNAFGDKEKNIHINDLGHWCNIYFPYAERNPLYYAKHLYIGEKEITNLVIPDKTTDITMYAFAGAKNLKSVSFHENINSIGYNAFMECNNINTIYCYALEPPSLGSNAFSSNVYLHATLIVPKGAKGKYQNAKEWKAFLNIIEENEKPSLQQCEMPLINYSNGKILLNCNTPGATYYYTLSAPDVANNSISSNGIISLKGKYDIYAYATAEGYKQSNTATATLYWLNANLETDNINQAQTRGIVVSSDNGIISISGLDNNEKVSFYSTEGMVLGSQKAIDGRVSYAVGTAQKIIIVKIGDNSIKVMNP